MLCMFVINILVLHCDNGWNSSFVIVYLKTSTHRHFFIYYLTKIGETLSEDVIISSHAVLSEVECSVKCLEKSPTCVGYNYKPKSTRYAVNCQLSNETRGKNQEIGANKKWEFYQNLQKVRIKICYVDFLATNECLSFCHISYARKDWKNTVNDNI